MKHVIIGTAGHVDHGKTVLVKALTGTDTDRLAEEKRRGITIEPGFARLDWPDGTQAGIVDVPGHEKFIKNMLAGAGGIDLAMLVIAADEGVMSQTVEHLDILSLLGVQGGLVVLTKAELVDDDWLEFVRRQALELTEGTFLEGAPILSVSAVTGQGIPELRDALYRLVQEAREKSALAPFRLPIDRVFSVDGFGTVVTGTLTEGAVRVGDAVELVPSGLQSRVRTLQVHGESVDAAYAGQRAALNLTNLQKTEIHRGDAAVRPGSVRPSRMLDVRLRCLESAKRTVLNGSQVHLYHGTSVHLAKAVLLDRDELRPGESCLAQQQRKNRNGKSRSGSYAVTNGCLLLRHGRFQSAGKLVGAGGASAAAVDALQAGNGLLGLHALHQSGDALEVAVAAAYHLKITDHALIVYLYRHGPGADAPGLECICHIVLPSFLIRLENRITQFFLSAKPGF